MPTPKNIDEYIAAFPPEVQAVLEQMRGTIRKAAPDAEEAISYEIPTFKLNGRYLIYFAGYKRPIAVTQSQPEMRRLVSRRLPIRLVRARCVSRGTSRFRTT